MGDVVRLNKQSKKNLSARRHTVLLVDDESAITVLFEMELSRLGYCVLTASSALEAKLVATEFHSTIDVLIADWKMPDLTGDQLARNLLLQHPSLKVVLISGNPKTEVVCQAFEKNQIAFLQKPFGSAVLNETIKQLLGLTEEPSSQVV